MRIDIITIFPEAFTPLEVSIVGRARERGVLEVHVHDLRDYTADRHRQVDDTPYGGGPGDGAEAGAVLRRGRGHPQGDPG